MDRRIQTEEIEKLTRERVDPAQRQQIVRRLLAQAAAAPAAAGERWPVPPVDEAGYEGVLSRAFERAWRLHRQLVRPEAWQEQEDEAVAPALRRTA